MNDFFWLHIKKAGGESFRKTFTPPYVQTDKVDNCRPFIALPKEEWNDALNNYRIPLGDYDYKRMLFAKKFLFTPEEFDNMFKFVIVRNPYDRAVSCWKYFYGYQNISKLITNPRNYYKKLSFQYFLEQLPREWEHKHHRALATHTASMWSDITDRNGKLLVDKILKLENMSDNIDFLNKKLNINIKEFSHINKSRSDNSYQKYYNKKTRKIVERYYRDDIENLGYKF
ncbi:sulfotransferase family protein [Psychroserpens sp. SPM9]|uniref:sulfotransferase family protein n=1 Tax=Psychroserpens sp. SPM9 TaxID=2975598 RepID=UPI0021A7FB5B|nr:sulfotransferase family protein [Psychroserpens sp. SPM9]MDG5490134.1 sulfotransferase family protein [Psychroserpens sp. SPM9]